MNTISVQTIKHRGIGAVAKDKAYIERVKIALNEVKIGQVKRFKNAKALFKHIEQEA